MGKLNPAGCLDLENRANLVSKRTKYHPSIASAKKAWTNNYNDGISFEDFLKLSQMPCYYCGAAPSNICNAAKKNKSSDFVKENGNFKYNGLDRLDNSKPHTLENCVPCCKWCNLSKNNRSVEEFLKWAKRLAKFQESKESSNTDQFINEIAA